MKRIPGGTGVMRLLRKFDGYQEISPMGWLFLAACSIAVFGPALAQTSSSAGAAPAAEAGSGNTETVEFQEIVVNAQRRSERISDVPISVTAGSGKALQASV